MKIAIKLGTSTLTHNTGKLNIRRVENLCKVISDLANAGNEIIIISSGAIAMGAGKMNMKSTAACCVPALPVLLHVRKHWILQAESDLFILPIPTAL